MGKGLATGQAGELGSWPVNVEDTFGMDYLSAMIGWHQQFLSCTDAASDKG